jgi:hypothetical protein
MSKIGEQAAAETRETAQIIRMSDYHPKKKGALTVARRRSARQRASNRSRCALRIDKGRDRRSSPSIARMSKA